MYMAIADLPNCAEPPRLSSGVSSSPLTADRGSQISLSVFDFGGGSVRASAGDTAGASAANHGYVMAGYASGNQNYIEKYPYATQTNATDVGDLTTIRYGGSGSHY